MQNELDVQAKRRVLRLFTYGMYVVTAQHDGVNNAFLANWLSQCSFDPPLLMLSVENASRSLPMILGSAFFAVHVLASGQREFAGMLGKSSRTQPDKLKNIQWHPSELTGCPILEQTLGYVECRVTGHLPAGDSTVVVGQVIGARMFSEGEPLPLTMQETGFKHFG